MDSISTYSSYNKVLIINDTKQRKQKLLKKLQQSSSGGISTVENYYECCFHQIQGKSSISFHKDSTKNSCMHDMNLSDLRDLLINCLTGRKLNISKSFQLSNAPFIRKVIHLHIENCPSNEIAKALLTRIINNHSIPTANTDIQAAKHGDPYTDIQCIKVDKEIDFNGILPYKLLTVPYTKASEIISMDFASNNATAMISSENLSTSPRLKKIQEQDSFKFAVECRNMLLPYVLSPSQLHLWGYMQDFTSEVGASTTTVRHHLQGSHDHDCDNINSSSHSSSGSGSGSYGESDVKRRKITPDTDIDRTSIRKINLGINYGELPDREEAEHILTRCGSMTTKGNVSSTLSESSHAYNQLWNEISHPCNKNHHQPLPVAAIDCELCDTRNGLELTRITIIDANASIVLDSFVKPILPIINYRTQYSGITEDLLSNVTVTLQQIQVAVLRLISSETILIGHSLDNDLKAIKIAYHPLCIDTGILYPHSRGFPLRWKLKKLTLDFLQYSIQDSKSGHDSVEDARAALQLALLKAQNGHMFGVQNPDKQRISIFELIDSNTSKNLIINQKYEKDNKNSTDYNNTATNNDNTNRDNSAIISNVDSILLQQCVGGSSIFTGAKDIKHAVTLICDYLTEVSATNISDNSNNFSKNDINNSINRDYIHEVQLSKDTSQGPIASWIVTTTAPNIHSTNTDDNIENSENTYTDVNASITTIKVAKVIYSLANLQYPSSSKCSNSVENTDSLDEMVSLLDEQISRISSTLDSCNSTNNSSNTLLLLTTQCSLEPVVQMLQRRRISSKNNMSAMIWSAENELKLKELRKHNLAYLVARIL